MKRVQSILSISLMAAFLPINGHARSANIPQEDISELIEISLTRTENQNEACKTARRSISNKCGQSYIYPVLSNHPDGAIASKINNFIEGLAPTLSDDFSRIESWTEVTLNKKNILSLSYTGQTYGKAAFADQSTKVCSNLDLITGEELALSNILKPEFEENLPRLIFENIDSDLKRKLPGYLRSVLRQKGEDWALNKSQSFLLNEQDFSLCFDQGVLSQETVGPVAISLPYSLIADLIDETGPLAFVLNQKNSEPVQPIEPVSIAPPPPTESAPLQPAKDIQPAEFETSENRIGSVNHICFKDSVTHKISVVEHDADSPFICIVEYDKVYEQKVLWRSRKTKAFCHSNAEKLVSKYENQWGYTCGSTSTLPEAEAPKL